MIPYKYEESFIKNAIKEAKEKVDEVVSPSSIIEYKVPTPKLVKVIAYLDIEADSDINAIKRDIVLKTKDYINNIAPGERMMLGKINSIGLAIKEVEYFNAIQVYIDNKEVTDFEVLQTIQDKLIFEEIIFWEVEK